jgi:hypothetical protein
MTASSIWIDDMKIVPFILLHDLLQNIVSFIFFTDLLYEVWLLLENTSTYLLSIYLHSQKVEKLKALCLQYATSIQLLIPSIEVTNPDNTSKPGKSRSRINKSQEKDQQLKLVSENVVMSESILYVSHIALYLPNDKIKVRARYLIR